MSKIIYLILVTIFFVFGVNDMKNGSFSHLSLWTWNFHIATLYYLLLGSNSIIRNIMLSTSYIGSLCILICYFFVLFLNPRLEFDLNPNKSNLFILIRSIIGHLIPVILFWYLLPNVHLNYYLYYLFLIIPIFHLITGLIFKLITGSDTFNGYNIYINYNKNSNRYKISEGLFIIVNIILMISIVNLVILFHNP